MTLNFPKSIYTAAEATTASISPANASPSDQDTGTIGSYGYTFDDDRMGSGANDGRWVLNDGVTYSITNGATYTWDFYKWKASNIPDSSTAVQTSDNPSDGEFLKYDGTLGVNVWAADNNTTYSTVSTSAAGLAPTLPASHGGKFLKADGTWEVPPDTDTDTTYSAATTSADGLMSSTDKSKLDGIASNANNYSLPTATSSAIGGFKVIDEDDMVSNVDDAVPTQQSVKAYVGNYTVPRKLVGKTEETEEITVSSSSATLDFTNHGLHKWDIDSTAGTVGVNTSYWSPAADEVQSTTVMVRCHSSSSITLPTTTWVGGSQPSISSTKFSVIEFWYIGSTLYGAYIGDA